MKLTKGTNHYYLRCYCYYLVPFSQNHKQNAKTLVAERDCRDFLCFFLLHKMSCSELLLKRLVYVGVLYTRLKLQRQISWNLNKESVFRTRIRMPGVGELSTFTAYVARDFTSTCHPVGRGRFPYLERIFTAQPKYSVPLLSWHEEWG